MPNWNEYIKPNTGLLFYKHIYKESDIQSKVAINEKGELIIKIGEKDSSPFDVFYKELCERKFVLSEQIENNATNAKFELKTTYPGLLIGSGYLHNGQSKGDFKIGFFFDYTTGQPIIPGSSVKGVLHSLFEMDIDGEGEKAKNITGGKSVAAIQFILDEILEKIECEVERNIWENYKNTLNAQILKSLVDNIFGSQDKEGTDVFYDAVINIATSKPKDSKFLGTDFITPHYENPLKNPKPLMFLKVLPNIVFQFRFKFKKTCEFWTIDRKAIFFKQILLDLGIGAKTNVGYGQFKDETVPQNGNAGGEGNGQNGGNQIQTKNIVTQEWIDFFTGDLKTKVFEGEIVEIDNGSKGYVHCKFGENIIIQKKKEKLSGAIKGGKVTMTISQLNIGLEINCTINLKDKLKSFVNNESIVIPEIPTTNYDHLDLTTKWADIKINCKVRSIVKSSASGNNVFSLQLEDKNNETFKMQGKSLKVGEIVLLKIIQMQGSYAKNNLTILKATIFNG